jgi:hypothetical protein
MGAQSQAPKYFRTQITEKRLLEMEEEKERTQSQ